MSVARTQAVRRSRRRRSARTSLATVVAVATSLVVAFVVLIGFGLAGSPDRLAAGVTIAGVNVGGLGSAQARARLERRSQALLNVPVVFTAGGRRFRVTPDELGVRVDWKQAVAAARREGQGFGPLRGIKRLDVRVFGAEVAPAASVYTGALDIKLDRIAAAVDRPHLEPWLRLRGTAPVVVPGSAGRVLDRTAAARILVRALTGFQRGTPVALPIRTDPPRVPTSALAPAADQVGRALAAPVQLRLGPTRFRLPRWRIAQLLQLPADGRTQLRVGGSAASAWLAALGRRIARAPRDAQFAVNGSSVRIVPAQDGLRLDAPATAKAVFGAALRPTSRVARIAVVATPATRTTAAAQSMGISGLVSSYTTSYGGIANRIHNVQLVAHLIDDKLIAPGATFSFNETTGARTADKGFLVAPVIVNGELSTGLGGGVCQVSTTVFNAAFDAGLEITQRTNHALYISHYPQGRDATVDYPSVDLKFVNDSPHWLLLRTFVGSSRLTVNLYGTPLHRKVESTTSPLVTTGAPKLKKTVDPSLKPGNVVVDDSGAPSLSTSVHRLVYAPSGKLLHDDTWYSSYRSSPKLVRVGPKKKPAAKKTKPGATATTTSTTPATSTATTPQTTTHP